MSCLISSKDDHQLAPAILHLWQKVVNDLQKKNIRWQCRSFCFPEANSKDPSNRFLWQKAETPLQASCHYLGSQRICTWLQLVTFINEQHAASIQLLEHLSKACHSTLHQSCSARLNNLQSQSFTGKWYEVRARLLQIVTCIAEIV